MGLLRWLRLRRKARPEEEPRRRRAHGRRARRTAANGIAPPGHRLSSTLSAGSTEYYSADELSSISATGLSGAASPRADGGKRVSADWHASERKSERARSHVAVGDDNVVEDGGPRGRVVLAPADDESPGCGPVRGGGGLSRKRMVLTDKPVAGTSFSRRSTQCDKTGARETFEQPDATTYYVRGKDYMKTKKKVLNAECVMQLVTIDVFATDFKLYHIARHLELPPAPRISDEALARGFTPLLVLNLQCPLYNPSFFGTHDGDGGSLIYYFAFPEGWHPDDVDNKAALLLLERFWRDEAMPDGTTARERLKLIPRIANVDEWARVGPLTAPEHKILVNYNDKPVLTRPQQRFFRGPNYLEVDLDVHSWNFIARRTFFGYTPKLASVVFENAFVLQGNCADELPEVVMACVRVYRCDFLALKTKRRFPLREEISANPDV